MIKTFLDKSHSPYLAVQTAMEKLQSAGFKAAKLNEIRSLQAGDYYVPIHNTALFALRIPEGGASTLRIATAHTDFPCFKLKPVADMPAVGGCQKENVEPYGGMLKRTWFDRPLGVAGAVWVRSDDAFNPEMRLVDINEPLAVIPSLAPHLDREIESKKLEPQKELIPITGMGGSIMDVIAKHAGCTPEDILSTDLNLFVIGEMMSAGADNEFIMSQAIDNMASVSALVEAFVEGNAPADHMSMICLFDNEEIGSRTKQGADSNTLKMVLDQLDVDYETSFILSVDGAHAVHPNYPEKSDPTAKIELGGGIALKTSASQRYATDGKMIAMIRSICEKNDIPCQLQANKSGAPGGSTLGPIVSAYIPMPAADLGIPMLAMHSACELAATRDYDALVAFMKAAL